jgi:two-component system LytT family response regulator
MLKEHCPDVQVMSVYYSAADALSQIQSHEPELLFLDIEMPEMNAFQLLDKLRPFRFELILMSELPHNAINAIHYNALDYLLKPVGITDLKKAVERSRQLLASKSSNDKLETMLNKMHDKLNSIEKVALPTLEGLHMVSITSIVYAMSNSNYTNFILKENQKLHVCRTLKEVENMLAPHPFIRVHHSYIVNLNEVKKYIKGEGGTLIMSDNTNINVSRSHKEILLKKLLPGKI